MLNRHIFLIGMPGAGKSSLSRRCAKNLELPLIDMDQRVLELTGFASTTELFAAHGENAFRVAETNLLIQLTREEPALISTGGGTILNPVNRAIMRNFGYIIMIDRPVEEIKQGIRVDTRPLLKEKGLGELDRISDMRMGIYRSVADEIMDNSQGFANGLHTLERILRSRFIS